MLCTHPGNEEGRAFVGLFDKARAFVGLFDKAMYLTLATKEEHLQGCLTKLCISPWPQKKKGVCRAV